MTQQSTWQGFTQETVNRNCHSREFLSGIPTACNDKKGGDPRFQASGMTSNLMSGLHLTYKGCSGFTLIELLVVVLIIGLLATVALPQYNKAVRKAHGTEALATLDTVEKALTNYYLSNDTYEGADTGILDITLPPLTYFKYSVGTGPFSTGLSEPHLQVSSFDASFALVSPEDLLITLAVERGKLKSKQCRMQGSEKGSVACDDYFHCVSSTPREYTQTDYHGIQWEGWTGGTCTL